MNMIKCGDYKLNKYASIHDDCKAYYRSHSIHLYTIEVSSLGVEEGGACCHNFHFSRCRIGYDWAIKTNKTGL